MMYIPRKIVYSTFTIIFALAIILIIINVFLTQGILIQDPKISIIKKNLELEFNLKNSSNHIIKDITVNIIGSDKPLSNPLNPENEKLNYYIKTINPDENLKINYNFEFKKEDIYYYVYFNAPFERQQKIEFKIDESLLNPISMEIMDLPLAENNESLSIGTEYTFLIKLCNLTKSKLQNIILTRTVYGDYFKEKELPIQVSLESECKTLYYTLTPINPGKTKVDFIVAVNNWEDRITKELLINGEE